MFQPISLPPLLEAKFQAHMERTKHYFSNLEFAKPEAVILGGGYGRGEGGIAVDDLGTPSFFNDLDYFIFTSNPNDAFLLKAIREWEEKESKELEIDVEGKCLHKEDLKETPTSMMFYDLVSGYRIIMGSSDYLEPYQSLANPETIAVIEATRLLWNRGSGLLFARSDLEWGGDLSIVHRNQSKAKLALGDALLTIRGKYRPYARERQFLLEQERDINPQIAQLHKDGVAFKLHPTATPNKETLLNNQDELTQLWITCFLEVESARLNINISDSKSYASYPGKLFPKTSSLRNCLLAVRDQIKRSGHVRPLKDYPRGALQRTLVLLLDKEPDYDQVSWFLGKRLDDLTQAVGIYQKWWHHYS